MVFHPGAPASYSRRRYTSTNPFIGFSFKRLYTQVGAFASRSDGGIHDWGCKEPDLDQDRPQIADVAEVDGKHAECQRHTGGEQCQKDGRQHDKWQPGKEGAPGEQQHDQQQPHLDRELDAGVQHVGEDQHFAWKRNTANQSGVGGDGTETQRRDEREEVPRQQTAEEVQREIVEAGRHADRSGGVEQRAEDEAVDDDLRQRIEHRPRPPEEGAAVFGAEFTKREVPQQLARAVDVGDRMHGRNDVIAMPRSTIGMPSGTRGPWLGWLVLSGRSARLASAMSTALAVNNLWKSYRLYHERNQYLKAAILKMRRSRYEEFWALKDINFEVPTGSTFGVIGSNGSGKSTLLKTMAGILQPERGDVAIEGRVSALLELGAGFHPELSGRENVFLNGAILGMSKKDITARYDAIVEFAGLEDFIDTPVKNYSSGMFVRLGFAVAANVEPDVLLIDEVLSVGTRPSSVAARRRSTSSAAMGAPSSSSAMG